MKRVAIIGAILDNPDNSQFEFNKVVSEFKQIVRGRMGLPFQENNVSVSVVSIITCAEIDVINKFTGKLGKIDGVTIKVAFSKQEIE